MTHERKPESAEFRTREAQVADLAFEISDWKSYDDNEDITIARAHIDEAEARGAAEQRRKDAAISPAVTEELATALNELGQARAVIAVIHGAPRNRQDAEALETLERYGRAVRAALNAWQHIREGGAT